MRCWCRPSECELQAPIFLLCLGLGGHSEVMDESSATRAGPPVGVCLVEGVLRGCAMLGADGWGIYSRCSRAMQHVRSKQKTFLLQLLCFSPLCFRQDQVALGGPLAVSQQREQ